MIAKILDSEAAMWTVIGISAVASIAAAVGRLIIDLHLG